MFHAAIKHLTIIEKEFQEDLESREIKLTAKGERDYLKLKKEWMKKAQEYKYGLDVFLAKPRNF